MIIILISWDRATIAHKEKLLDVTAFGKCEVHYTKSQNTSIAFAL